jgi:hypothetical protein
MNDQVFLLLGLFWTIPILFLIALLWLCAQEEHRELAILLGWAVATTVLSFIVVTISSTCGIVFDTGKEFNKFVFWVAVISAISLLVVGKIWSVFHEDRVGGGQPDNQWNDEA